MAVRNANPLDRQGERIHGIDFSPNGHELAAVCGDLFIQIWNLETGAVPCTIVIEWTSSGFDIAYLDQGRLLFAGSIFNGGTSKRTDGT